MNWIGLDIGGANLKLSDGGECARSEPFALWRNPDGLSDALAKLIGEFSDADAVAAVDHAAGVDRHVFTDDHVALAACGLELDEAVDHRVRPDDQACASQRVLDVGQLRDACHRMDLDHVSAPAHGAHRIAVGGLGRRQTEAPAQVALVHNMQIARLRVVGAGQLAQRTVADEEHGVLQ